MDTSDTPAIGVAIVGMGIMGSQHARAIAGGHVRGARLAAVCDVSEQRCAGHDVASTGDTAQIAAMDDVGAVVIATPHYSHVPIAEQMLAAGKHVLVEKPISPTKAGCERLVAVHEPTGLVAAAMFNQRTNPRYRTLRQLVQDGQLGAIQRVVWIVTDWYRTDAYYRSSSWRATWGGEGGGVLLNQSPHQLDLWQWMFGMPNRITAFCGFGRHHDIEVEDDVTAHLDYDDGCRGTFITTTGDTPGTNRLEVTGDLGRAIIDGAEGDLVVTFNETGAAEFARSAAGGFDKPATRVERHRFEGEGGQHIEVLRDFVEAITTGRRPLAGVADGIHSVELANAMLMSSFENRTVELPIDAASYEAHIARRTDG